MSKDIGLEVRRLKDIAQMIAKDCCADDNEKGFANGFAQGFYEGILHFVQWRLSERRERLGIQKESLDIVPPSLRLLVMYASPTVDCPSVEKYMAAIIQECQKREEDAEA